MSRSVASAVAPDAAEIMMPKVVGTFPEFLAAAIRRAVRAGGSWPEAADRVAMALRRQLPGPGLLTPGQLTPIHDHLSWCVTAVLQGAEYEEIFAVRDGHLEVIARNQNPAGAVSGFAPPGDIHRVRNSCPTVAVSMHVYGTDITRVGSSIRRLYDLPVR